MGYTRPHTGQGKELSFGVWEGIMRGQRERRGEGRGCHLWSHHPYQQSRPQAEAPHSPDPASSFWERRRPVSQHSFPTAPSLSPDHRPSPTASSEPVEKQRVSTGRMLSSHRRHTLCWLSGLTVFPPPFTEHIFALQAPRSLTGKSPREQASTW